MTNKKNEESVATNQFGEKLGILQCSFKEAKKVAMLSLECGVGHVPVFISEAGTGKSQVCRQIARPMGARAVFFFLAHVEREDIGGIPFPNEGEGTASYRFLCEETILDVIRSPEPTLLVLDEWNRGEKAVMNAAFTLMEDRRFGSHVLPDHVSIMACMNPSEGSYLVNEAEKDPAFRRRLCFVAIRTDPAVWLEWATTEGNIHFLVTGYIQSSQSSLMDVQAREAGKIYANPASWEKVSQTLYTMERLGMDLQQHRLTLKYKLGGHIGAGMSENFLKWAEENSVLVDPMDILYRYDKGARRKVKQLIKQARNDLINECCEGVALALLTHEPDILGEEKHVAENTGQFAADLTVDFAKAFFQKCANHATELQKDQ